MTNLSKPYNKIFRIIALAVLVTFGAESCLLAAPAQEADSVLRPVRAEEKKGQLLNADLRPQTRPEMPSAEEWKRMEEITKNLVRIITWYYQQVRNLQETKRPEAYPVILGLLSTTIRRILNEVQKIIPEEKRLIWEISQEEPEALTLDEAINILGRYYQHFGKFFTLCRISEGSEDKLAEDICQFVLGDRAILPGDETSRPDVPAERQIEIEEIAIENLLIDPIAEPVRAFASSRFGRHVIVYNLDFMRREAAEAWLLWRDYPNPLTSWQALKLIKAGDESVCLHWAFGYLLRQEFAGCQIKSKKDFSAAYMLAARKTNFVHEFMHLIRGLEKHDSDDPILAFLHAMAHEGLSYWRPIGYSQHPYLALLDILTVCYGAELYDESAHRVATYLCLQTLIDNLLQQGKLKEFAGAETLEVGQRYFYYATQLARVPRDALSALGRLTLTFEPGDNTHLPAEPVSTQSISGTGGDLVRSP